MHALATGKPGGFNGRTHRKPDAQPNRVKPEGFIGKVERAHALGNLSGFSLGVTERAQADGGGQNNRTGSKHGKIRYKPRVLAYLIGWVF